LLENGIDSLRGFLEIAEAHFQSHRQNPTRRSARPTATFLARRATRRGLPLLIASTSRVARAALNRNELSRIEASLPLGQSLAQRVEATRGPGGLA
jgi:hypothetical protein